MKNYKLRKIIWLATLASVYTSCSHMNENRRIRLPSNASKNCAELVNSVLKSGRRNKPLSEESLIELYQDVSLKKSQVAYPDIPPVEQLHLSRFSPREIVKPEKLSPGLSSSELEEARELGGIFEDYKILSDVKPRNLSDDELVKLKREAQVHAKREVIDENSDDFRRAYLKFWIENRYTFEKDLIPADSEDAKVMWSLKLTDPRLIHENNEAFDYVESYWKNLIRETPEQTTGSIVPLPYEFVVANSTRFDEMYYWDTYFGMQGLLATGRLDLSQKIVENFLYMIRNYGIIPNGNRDYYLTRSQPPFISSMVKDVFEATLKSGKYSDSEVKEWLAQRAYPLLKGDFDNFWMKPNSRFDEKTFLHHHYDEVDHPRPERHSADKDMADSWDDEQGLGLSYRDTRAVAESGLDFTDALGKEAAQTANTLLNSMIYKYAKDLEEFAEILGLEDDVQRFREIAQKKKRAMDKYLWNDETGSYQNYLIKDGRQLDGLSADNFTALYTQVASPEQASEVVKKLRLLEKDGGVMSSLFTESHHQWDGDNGWAPLHFFVIQGLRNYGYDEDAERIALKLANSYADIYKKEGVFLERIDVATGARPVEDGKKYPVQEGFLWTNGVYTWILKNILNQEFKPASK
ncbi:MAG: hypothetical protein CME60_12250 [Halobacteriovoraceae bacterium]|nr:hypothetical protein [Halobacteriovoraceae bacterium]